MIQAYALELNSILADASDPQDDLGSDLPEEIRKRGTPNSFSKEEADRIKEIELKKLRDNETRTLKNIDEIVRENRSKDRMLSKDRDGERRGSDADRSRGRDKEGGRERSNSKERDRDKDRENSDSASSRGERRASGVERRPSGALIRETASMKDMRDLPNGQNFTEVPIGSAPSKDLTSSGKPSEEDGKKKGWF